MSTNVHVVDVPEQAPPQPVKVTPGSGVAVNVTLVFAGKLAEQPAPVPQEMPEGLLETVPLPARESVSFTPEPVPPPPPPVAVESFCVTAMVACPPSELQTVANAGAVKTVRVAPLNWPNSNCIVPIAPPKGSVPKVNVAFVLVVVAATLNK